MPAEILLGGQDHVVPGPEVPLFDLFLVDQVERNPKLVEREAVPAQVLGVGPLRIDRDPGQLGVVHRPGWERVEGGPGESEFLGRRAHGRGRRHVADDERAGRKLGAPALEALLGDLHRNLFQPVPEADHVVGAEMGNGHPGGAFPGRRALRRGDRDWRDRDFENRRIGDFDHVHIHGESHGPATVVVGVEPGVRIELFLEQVFGQPAVWLIALDDVRPRGIGDGVDLERLFGLPDLDPLNPEDVDELGRLRHVPLDRNEVSVWGLRLTLLNRVSGLDVEVLEYGGGEHRRELECREHAGLHVVGVGPPRELGGILDPDRDAAIPLPFLGSAHAARHQAARRGNRRRRLGFLR